MTTALAAVPRRRPAPTRHRAVASLEGLRLARRRGVDLCRWPRAVDPHFSAWLDALAPSAPTIDERVTARTLDAARWMALLPESPWRDALAEDVAALARTALEVSGAPRARVQFGWVTGQQCPRFHTDFVALRLICTYVGPGTEWIEERWLDRALAEHGHGHEPPLRAGGQPSQLGRFEVAFMKGRAFPGNERHGVVHRSPPTAGRPRLVLVINEAR
jgi:hypothetical protein